MYTVVIYIEICKCNLEKCDFQSLHFYSNKSAIFSTFLLQFSGFIDRTFRNVYLKYIVCHFDDDDDCLENWRLSDQRYFC